jgi:molybdate transport system substrate-binding protein
MRAWILALALVGLLSTSVTAQDAVRLHAAGSLRVPLTEIARNFEAAGRAKIQAKFSASGLLKDEIAVGAG